MKRIDPWQLLNVRPGDDADTLKTNYKAAMLAAHPDRGGTDEAASILNRAYEFLSSKLVGGRVPGPLEAGLRPANEVMRPPPPVRVVRFVIVTSSANPVSTTTSYQPSSWGPTSMPTGGYRPW